ncbi:hypothetical protein OVS_02475 [Mycoplasma ovis str. Michigan]|uniref:Uncharacterized protein n=1 Tax=Mycoplasma ovis str. Michigan TaxID=1415773 RepID=A0ABN4BLS5_9MOLU|nr:hypothetical protein [Mycoplasma ovis]AHC40333.1 hypothetical protein OVS_02475 [Mycoplasma ovis str. Michigan]
MGLFTLSGILSPIITLSTIQTSNWTFSSSNGLYTRVRLFINGAEAISQTGISNFLETGQKLRGQYNIQQISQLISSASSTNNPALIVEVPLAKLGSFKNYKYCIPETSPLIKGGTQSTVSSGQKATVCKLNYLHYHTEKYPIEEVTFLLDLITKFIELQHAANILMFYDDSTNYRPSVAHNGGKGTEYMESIKQACGLRDISPKKLIKDLFFEPKTSIKNCFLSPSTAKIHLDISKTSSSHSSSTETSNLTIERLKQGKLKGSLRYGIFEYSKKLKKIETQNGTSTQKYLIFDVNWPLTFYKQPDQQNNCSVNSLFNKVRKRELTYEELKKKCI